LLAFASSASLRGFYPPPNEELSCRRLLLWRLASEPHCL
jgi:hypothetical protein